MSRSVRCAICLVTLAAFSLATLADAVVVFPDDGLEAAIRSAISKPTGDIYESDLVGLWSLGAEYRGISDLTGIEHCVDLAWLGLYTNHISNLGPLAGLTKLTKLILTDNQVSDLGPLAGLTSLWDLYLSSNQITDLSSLAGLTGLVVLHLGGNQVSDLSPLAGLTALDTLYLDGNQISDIDPLASLTALVDLSLTDNQISDIGALAGLTALWYLRLQYNEVTDLASLAGKTALEYLRLNDNQISSLGPLVGLTALKELSLSNNQISDLAPLSGLTALTSLGLSSNQISNLAPLSGLTSLESLGLSNNQISDLSPLDGLTALTWLYLHHNEVTSLAPLVSSTGIDSGDDVDVRWNHLCLNVGSGEDLADLNLLLARGVWVNYDPQTSCQPDSTAAVFRVTNEGIVRADSSFYGSAFNTGSADLAEWVPLSVAAEAGTVLELDITDPGSYRPSQASCSSLIAGVVSTLPGITLGTSTVGPQQALLALSGIVPVKVTNEGGQIQPGDLLVSSSTPGYAMRWTGPEPCPCSLVGKALESMTDELGVISVLLTAH